MFGFALGAWTNSLYVDLTGNLPSLFYSRIFELLVWYLTYLTVPVFLVCWSFSKCDLIGILRYILRRLEQIRRYVEPDVIHSLVHASVTSHLDYCNGLLAGCNAYTVRRLHRVQNTAARLVLDVPHSSWSQPLLRELQREQHQVQTVCFTGCLHVPIVGRTGLRPTVCQTSRTDRSDRL